MAYSQIIDPLPTHYLPVHQSAIRAIAWINAPPAKPDGSFSLSADPCIIASGGHDGVECVTDIRDPGGNVINRTRGKPYLFTRTKPFIRFI
jgi:transcription factor C subunit 6